jgi:predicted metal-dependent hydrolase
LPRRVLDFLKKQAREDLSNAIDFHAERLGVKPKSISIRDSKTRWGSCSSNGTLSFSWRIILAPSDILDYLAAHEVAHLREMNHSPRFWKLVEDTCPHTKQSRAWLKAHGAILHALVV